MRKALLVIMILGFVGCVGPEVRTANRMVVDGKAIYVGMSTESLEKVLGSPDKVKVDYPDMFALSKPNADPLRKAYRWTYIRKDGEYSVFVDRGRVTFICEVPRSK